MFFKGMQRAWQILLCHALLFSALPAQPLRAGKAVLDGEFSTSTARKAYDDAMAFERKGDLLRALVEYQRAANLYPEKMKAAPEPFYTSALERAKDIHDGISKAKQSPEVLRKVQNSIKLGNKHLAAGRYREARLEFRDVLEIESGNKEAQAGLARSSGELEKLQTGRRKKAKAAASGGRQIEAIQAWREVLEADPGDAEARAYFEDNAAFIKETLRACYAKGIERYQAGAVPSATAIWKKCLALDPADPLGMRHDIGMAEKGLKIVYP